MDTEKYHISEFLTPLAEGGPLSDDAIEPLILELAHIIRYDPETYYKGQFYGFAWDDAWDSLMHFRPYHFNALPHLAKIVDTPVQSNHEEYVRIWALRAIGTIRGDISKILPTLLRAIGDRKMEIRQEAARTLRNCGYGYLIKRLWYSPFDWSVR